MGGGDDYSYLLWLSPRLTDSTMHNYDLFGFINIEFEISSKCPYSPFSSSEDVVTVIVLYCIFVYYIVDIPQKLQLKQNMIIYNNSIKNKYKRIKIIVCFFLFATSSDL